MKRLVVLFVWVAGLLLMAVAPALAEKRVALVIGNDDYASLPKLLKAANDARAVSAVLKGMGFEVISGENLSRRETNRLLADFEAVLKPGDQAFLFFAGHGVAIGGENYLLPTDMPKPRAGEEGLVQDEGHAVNALIVRVQAKGALSSFFVLDACRDNPFAAAGVRSIGTTRGLTRVTAPSGVFVLFSAGIGQRALDRLNDSDPDPNSVFTRKLVPLLKTPGLSHVRIAKQVQKEVAALAASVRHDQQPAYYDQIIGDVVLLPGDAPKDSAPAVEPKVAVGVFPEPAKPSAPARKREAGEVFDDCDKCPEMVVVPAGKFAMGPGSDDTVRRPYEVPQHAVTIARPFAAGRYEVTFEEWEACVAERKCNRHRPQDEGWGRGRRPVIHVSWNDAQEYVKWLSERTGKPYRLLSEAEWEFAARAGSDKPFPGGYIVSTDEINFNGLGEQLGSPDNRFRGKTIPVGSFAPNAFGLFDMQGNVDEWTQDCWHVGYKGAPRDGSVWSNPGQCDSAVLRGGNYNSGSSALRSASRAYQSRDIRGRSIGFRVARDLTPEELGK